MGSPRGPVEGTRSAGRAPGAPPRDAHIAQVRRRLLTWWRTNARQFPWRNESDPYSVLVAEIMLRRTQAKQVAPVYSRFLAAFPDARSLSVADPDRIRRLLRPLGLRWRAEDMVRLSKALRVFAIRSNEFPEDLAALPGVGAYVEAAVRCFSEGRAVPIVDTNSARVAARLFSIRSQGEPRRSPAIRAALQRLVNTRRPKDVNWALLDLAAMVCRANVPVCSCCPLEGVCEKAGVGWSK